MWGRISSFWEKFKRWSWAENRPPAEVVFVRSKRVLVDLDGTLADYSEGYKGDDYIGPPLPQARELLLKLRCLGYAVVIYTSRCDYSIHPRSRSKARRNRRLIWLWLTAAGLAPLVDEVWVGDKPTGDGFIIDDRAITFRGDVDEVVNQIVTFGRWWEKE